MVTLPNDYVYNIHVHLQQPEKRIAFGKSDRDLGENVKFIFVLLLSFHYCYHNHSSSSIPNFASSYHTRKSL
jgi:hypothetical protein